MQTGMKFLIRNFLAEDQIETFAEWAFGEKFRQLRGTEDFLNQWNFTRGKDYKIEAAGNSYVDMKKMIAMWRESMDTKE